MSKNYNTRMNAVITKIGTYSANLSQQIGIFYTALDAGVQRRLSNSLRQGRRMFATNTDKTELRALRRAVMLIRMICDRDTVALARAHVNRLTATQLDRELRLRVALHSDCLGAAQTTPFGVHANCYAYAAGCAQPQRGIRGGAYPGAHADIDRRTQQYMGLTYPQQMVVSVEADGGIVVGDRNVAVLPNIEPGYYLVGLLTHKRNSGFHFIRRNETTGRWSWKDGNSNPVAHSVYPALPNDPVIALRMHRPITDRMIVDLIQNGIYAPWGYRNMRLTAWFKFPNRGITVAGRNM